MRARNRKIPDEFCMIDNSRDPHAFIQYLDKRNANHQISWSKQYLIGEILRPQKGEHILDVGCGVGHDSFLLAKLVGQKGRVIGIDISRTLLWEARRRGKKYYPQMNFQCCDAHCLPIPNDKFDGLLVSSTLMHLLNPQKALRELTRVLKPGGRIVCLESDWDTLAISLGNFRSEKTLINVLRKSVHQSGIGHQLPMLLWQVGLRNIAGSCGILTVADFKAANDIWRIQETLERASKTGLLSSSGANSLLKLVKASSAEGSFFSTVSGYIVWAQKPADTQIFPNKKLARRKSEIN